MMNESNTPYLNRWPCRLEVDIDENIIDFTKKSIYRCDKVNTSRYGLFNNLVPRVGAYLGMGTYSRGALNRSIMV